MKAGVFDNRSMQEQVVAPIKVDQQQFVRRFLASQRAVYAYILTFLPRQEEADDVMQETAVALWNKFEEYDEARASFTTWAKSFARYEVLKYRERQGRRPMVFDSEVVELLSEDLQQMEKSIDLRHDALKACIEKLPGERQEMIRWRYMEGFTIKQVAQKMGKKLDTIYKTISRSQSALLKCIELRMSQRV